VQGVFNKIQVNILMLKVIQIF